ncbi:MAG: UvrD-helicase domain-containing protein [Anaerolineae bacterium]|nr:UvrD-helicase domain-containing protein [Anaerolineae bacterium]
MKVAPSHRPTAGEKRLFALLNGLPKREFFFRYEPQIVTAVGASKPDFVLVSSLLGVLVIEVKDWRKLSGGTQEAIAVHTAGGSIEKLPNPVLQAEHYAYDLKDRFATRAELWEERKGRQALKFPWAVLVALPFIPQSEIARFEAVGIWPRGVVIGAEGVRDSASLEKAVRELPWKFKPERPLSLDMLDIIRELIDPSLRVDDAGGSPIGTLTRQQEALVREPVSVLLPKQASLFSAESLPSSHEQLIENAEVRLVRGVAGSGKTLVLARRAFRLHTEYPDARFLVLTFNTELARDIRERLGMDAKTPDAGLEITNFHKLCRHILIDHWLRPINARRWLSDHAAPELLALKLSSAVVAEELAWRRERNLLTDSAYLTADRKGRGYALDSERRTLINNMFNRYQADKQRRRAAGKSWFDWDDVAFLVESELERADHPLVGAYESILLDEGQDFTPSWLRVIKRLLRPGGALFLCDDPSQSIFHNYNWLQKGVSVIGRTVQLRVPFRSTMEISEAAHSLIEADDILRGAEERSELDLMAYELGRGPLPALVACPDAASEMRFVSEQVAGLLADGILPRQIAVLCHAYDQFLRWRHLSDRGVYVQIFERVKGLEFVNVFVPGLGSAFDDAHDAETVAAVRRKVFTALTRSRYRLVISYHGQLPAPLEALVPVTFSETYAPVSGVR